LCGISEQCFEISGPLVVAQRELERGLSTLNRID
jgi:hypothetical protein